MMIAFTEKIVWKTFRTFCLLVCCSPPCIFAQCNHDAQYIEESAVVAPLGEDGKIHLSMSVPASKVYPEYRYSISYDSVEIKYLVSEFRCNEKKVYFREWCQEKLWRNLSPGTISGMSRTETFSAKPGDTVHIYRELWWYDPSSGTLDPSRYYADNDIGYSVELVNALTNTRLALIDTIGLARQSPAGAPRIYSSTPHPAMGTASFILPSGFPHSDVFIRVNVHLEGKGDYALTRYDDRAICLSERHLADADWRAYSRKMDENNAFGKPTGNSSTDNTTILQILPQSGDGKITIKAHIQDNPATAVLQIVDNMGIVVYKQSLRQTDQEFTTVLKKNGVYIISLLQNGKLLQTEKIIVHP